MVIWIDGSADLSQQQLHQQLPTIGDFGPTSSHNPAAQTSAKFPVSVALVNRALGWWKQPKCYEAIKKWLWGQEWGTELEVEPGYSVLAQ